MGDTSLATLLREWRLAAGLSQEALAERSGLSVNGIAQIETGRRTAPRASTLRMLADALGMNAEQRRTLALAARRGPDAGAPTAKGTPEPAPADRPSLPIPPTPLVGRMADIAEVLSPLRDGDARIVTLTGPGGVGKTRLALAVARAWSAAPENVVVWVELAALADPQVIAGAIARAADVPENPARPVVDTLADAFGHRPLLLALDNCEHLLPAAGEVAANLLKRCPALRIVATSRSPLHIRGERLYAVPTLTLPDPHDLPAPAELAAVDAVTLFIQRARAARPDFALTEQNAATIADICHRLDGLPLALELAAARMRVLSPAALMGLLEERLRLLVGGPTDAHARLQTLRATVSWSHDLLTPEQQRLFRHLGVFAGGFTLEAAATIVAEGDHIAALEGMEALVDQSLLVRNGQPDEEVRFGMLETFRAFALEQLDAHGETHEARSRHAAWALALAESLEKQVDGPRHIEAMDRFGADHANLVHALAWLADHEESERTLRLAGAMMPYWHAAATLSEANAWLERALGLDTDATPSAARATALVAAGQAALLAGNFDRARPRLRDGIEMARAHDERDAELTGLYWLGCAALFLGSFDEARMHSTACLDLARASARPAMTSAALWSLGFVAMSEDDTDLAWRQLTESLALAREAGSPTLSAYVLCELANLDYRQERFVPALERATEALAMGRLTGHRGTTGQALGLLAEVSRARGDWDGALRHAEDHVTALRPGGAGLQLAWALRNLAFAAMETGATARAAALFAESLTMFRDQGVTLGIASNLMGIASLGARNGQPGRADRLVAAVGTMLDEAGLVLAPADAIALRRAREVPRAVVRRVGSQTDAEREPLTEVDAAVAEGLALAHEISARLDVISPIARRSAERE